MRYSPASDLKLIDALFVSGDLDVARRAAEAARQRESAVDAGLANRLRLEAARIALYQGRSREVLDLLAEPLGNPGDRGGEVQRMLYRSLALVRVGSAAEAQRLIAQAERQEVAPALRAEVLSTAGSVALDQDQAEPAKRLFGQSLRIAQRIGNRFLSMQLIGNLGVLALRDEHYDQASSLFARSAAIADSLGARFAQEKYEGNAGYALYGSGDWRRAALSFESAAREAERFGASSDLIAWLTNLSLCDFQSQRPALARAHAEKAFKYAKEINNQEMIGDAHLSLGFLAAQHEPGIAMEHADAAAAIADARKNRPEQLAAQTLRASLLAEGPGVEEGRRNLLLLARQPDLLPSLRWRVEDELGRLEDRRHRPQAAGLWFRKALGTYQRQRKTLQTLDFELPFQENASGLLHRYIDHLIAGGQEWEALRVLDQSRSEISAHPELRRAKEQTGAVAAQQLARRLGGTVLVYRVEPGQSYLWAVGERQRNFIRLGDGSGLLFLLKQHQAAVLASRDLQGSAGQSARTLFQKLVAPALPVIGHSDRVFIVAGDSLANLNFETLLTGSARPRFWIEDVAVTNARSLRLLVHSNLPYAKAAGSSRKLLLLGAQSVPGTPYPELPHVADEMAKVARHFAPAERTVLGGALATPTAYKQSRPGGVRFLHFASHGEADELQPMRSAILLNAPNGEPDAFRLSSQEIAAVPLHAELVTLSACYSAGARAYSGEGLVGLAWAFQRAGARHVIGALWEVSDATTPLLMDRLYAGLADGLAPDRALRAAKLALLHGPGVSRKPYYWAPFLLY